MARAGRQIGLSGVFASAITPHRPAIAQPDFAAALDLIEFIGGKGVQGICLLDSAGEFLNYSFAERQRLVNLGSKRSRVPLMVGVSHSTLSGAVQLADEAVSSGADGLLLMPPYFFRYSQPEIEEFYLQFARQASDAVPILLHNQPQFTSPLEIETVRRLVHTGRFAGIVDSGGSWSYFEELLDLRPFAVLAGNERLMAQALGAGANGVVSACACAVPELLVSLARGDAAAPARLSEFVDWVEKFPAPVAVKRAVELRKQKSGPPLTPLAAETRRELDQFAAWFTRWLNPA